MKRSVRQTAALRDLRYVAEPFIPHHEQGTIHGANRVLHN